VLVLKAGFGRFVTNLLCSYFLHGQRLASLSRGAGPALTSIKWKIFVSVPRGIERFNLGAPTGRGRRSRARHASGGAAPLGCLEPNDYRQQPQLLTTKVLPPRGAAGQGGCGVWQDPSGSRSGRAIPAGWEFSRLACSRCRRRRACTISPLGIPCVAPRLRWRWRGNNQSDLGHILGPPDTITSTRINGPGDIEHEVE